MSKSFFFLKDIPEINHAPICPDVYCPSGGYEDKNLGKTFGSKGEKFRYLRQHKLKEAEVFNPEKSLGGTDGNMRKRRGSPGNFKASSMASMPAWVKAELGRMAHV